MTYLRMKFEKNPRTYYKYVRSKECAKDEIKNLKIDEKGKLVWYEINGKRSWCQDEKISNRN